MSWFDDNHPNNIADQGGLSPDQRWVMNGGQANPLQPDPGWGMGGWGSPANPSPGDPSPSYLGPNGEWEPGPGELGGPVGLDGQPIDPLGGMASLGGGGAWGAPTPAPFSASAGGFTPPPGYSSAAWTGGAPPVFTAPDGITFMNDPGYQARLAEGNRGIQGSAAAAGNLLSGGTLKALAKYNQDYAANEYGNVYNRSLADFGAQNTNFQNRYATYLGENARTLSDYLTNISTQRNATNDYWARLLGLSQTGLGAATQGQGA